MQLKENHPELIKEKIFEEVYNKILKGENQNPTLVNLIFNYFHGNQQLFKVHYQPLETPSIFYFDKKCYACGQHGHIKKYCKVQGLTEQEQEEEIEWVYSKPVKKQEEIIKR